MSNVSKNLNLSVLLDFYGDVLTEKQKNVMELYYNEDLSLSEIAEHENISRQGIRDSIKRGEEIVVELEQKLGLVNKMTKLAGILDDIKDKATNIYNESTKFSYSKIISNNARGILECLEDNEDLI